VEKMQDVTHFSAMDLSRVWQQLMQDFGTSPEPAGEIWNESDIRQVSHCETVCEVLRLYCLYFWRRYSCESFPWSLSLFCSARIMWFTLWGSSTCGLWASALRNPSHY
jgi:hypothetical protein